MTLDQEITSYLDAAHYATPSAGDRRILQEICARLEALRTLQIVSRERQERIGRLEQELERRDATLLRTSELSAQRAQEVENLKNTGAQFAARISELTCALQCPQTGRSWRDEALDLAVLVRKAHSLRRERVSAGTYDPDRARRFDNLISAAAGKAGTVLGDSVPAPVLPTEPREVQLGAKREASLRLAAVIGATIQVLCEDEEYGKVGAQLREAFTLWSKS